MSFVTSIKGAIAGASAEIANQASRFKNKTFMNGVVAVCAHVAMASDGASPEKKQKMIGFIEQSDSLKSFDIKDVMDTFTKFTSSYDFDREIGKGETLKAVWGLRENPGQAQLAVRVGIAIANSDGNLDQFEITAIKDVCAALALNPADFISL